MKWRTKSVDPFGSGLSQRVQISLYIIVKFNPSILRQEFMGETVAGDFVAFAKDILNNRSVSLRQLAGDKESNLNPGLPQEIQQPVGRDRDMLEGNITIGNCIPNILQIDAQQEFAWKIHCSLYP
jgi:hypothetical protein